MGDIAFVCPECRANLSVDESGAGQEVSCPLCGKQIGIPATTKTGGHHSNTAPCPFCGKEIVAAALKCKHCGKPLAGMRKCKPSQHDVPSISPIEASMDLPTQKAKESIKTGTRIFQVLVVVLLAGNLFATASLLVAERHKFRFERMRAIAQENAMLKKIDLDLVEKYPGDIEAAMKEQGKRDLEGRKRSREFQKRLDEIMNSYLTKSTNVP